MVRNRQAEMAKSKESTNQAGAASMSTNNQEQENGPDHPYNISDDEENDMNNTRMQNKWQLKDEGQDFDKVLTDAGCDPTGMTQEEKGALVQVLQMSSETSKKEESLRKRQTRSKKAIAVTTSVDTEENITKDSHTVSAKPAKGIEREQNIGRKSKKPSPTPTKGVETEENVKRKSPKASLTPTKGLETEQNIGRKSPKASPSQTKGVETEENIKRQSPKALSIPPKGIETEQNIKRKSRKASPTLNKSIETEQNIKAKLPKASATATKSVETEQSIKTKLPKVSATATKGVETEQNIKRKSPKSSVTPSKSVSKTKKMKKVDKEISENCTDEETSISTGSPSADVDSALPEEPLEKATKQKSKKGRGGRKAALHNAEEEDVKSGDISKPPTKRKHQKLIIETLNESDSDEIPESPVAQGEESEAVNKSTRALKRRPLLLPTKKGEQNIPATLRRQDKKILMQQISFTSNSSDESDSIIVSTQSTSSTQQRKKLPKEMEIEVKLKLKISPTTVKEDSVTEDESTLHPSRDKVPTLPSLDKDQSPAGSDTTDETLQDHSPQRMDENQVVRNMEPLSGISASPDLFGSQQGSQEAPEDNDETPGEEVKYEKIDVDEDETQEMEEGPDGPVPVEAVAKPTHETQFDVFYESAKIKEAMGLTSRKSKNRGAEKGEPAKEGKCPICPEGPSPPHRPLENKTKQRMKIEDPQPYFAPPDTSAANYVKIITGYFRKYRSLLREMQKMSSTKVPLGDPVRSGPHCANNLFVKVRGQPERTNIEFFDEHDDSLPDLNTKRRLQTRHSQRQTQKRNAMDWFDSDEADEDDFVHCRSTRQVKKPKNDYSKAFRRKITPTKNMEVDQTESQYFYNQKPLKKKHISGKSAPHEVGVSDETSNDSITPGQAAQEMRSQELKSEPSSTPSRGLSQGFVPDEKGCNKLKEQDVIKREMTTSPPSSSSPTFKLTGEATLAYDDDDDDEALDDEVLTILQKKGKPKTLGKRGQRKTTSALSHTSIETIDDYFADDQPGFVALKGAKRMRKTVRSPASVDKVDHLPKEVVDNEVQKDIRPTEDDITSVDSSDEDFCVESPWRLKVKSQVRKRGIRNKTTQDEGSYNGTVTRKLLRKPPTGHPQQQNAQPDSQAGRVSPGPSQAFRVVDTETRVSRALTGGRKPIVVHPVMGQVQMPPTRGRQRLSVAPPVEPENIEEVECPLCSERFSVKVIEAHASNCEGPTEAVAEVQRPYNPRQEALPIYRRNPVFGASQDVQKDEDSAHRGLRGRVRTAGPGLSTTPAHVQQDTEPSGACPVCSQRLPLSTLEQHVNECLENGGLQEAPRTRQTRLGQTGLRTAATQQAKATSRSQRLQPTKDSTSPVVLSSSEEEFIIEPSPRKPQARQSHLQDIMKRERKLENVSANTTATQQKLVRRTTSTEVGGRSESQPAEPSVSMASSSLSGSDRKKIKLNREMPQPTQTQRIQTNTQETHSSQTGRLLQESSSESCSYSDSSCSDADDDVPLSTALLPRASSQQPTPSASPFKTFRTISSIQGGSQIDFRNQFRQPRAQPPGGVKRKRSAPSKKRSKRRKKNSAAKSKSGKTAPAKAFKEAW